MKHTYNNWSHKIFMGFYCTFLDGDSQIEDWTQTDRQEGYLTEYQHYDIKDWSAYKMDVARCAVSNLFNLLSNNDIIQDMELNTLYSPQYYNFETDSLIIDMKLNLTKLKHYCFKEHKEAFNKYLKDNFTSYDGFISYIANNIYTFMDDYKQKPNTKEINVMIEYYLLTQIYDNDSDFEGYSSYEERLYTDVNEILYEHLETITEAVA